MNEIQGASGVFITTGSFLTDVTDLGRKRLKQLSLLPKCIRDIEEWLKDVRLFVC